MCCGGRGSKSLNFRDLAGVVTDIICWSMFKIHSCWVDFVMSLGVRAFQPLALSASLVSASRETCAMREHLSAEREA